MGGLQTLRFQGPGGGRLTSPLACVPARDSQSSQGQQCLPSILAAAEEGHPLQYLQGQVSTIPRGQWVTFEPSPPKDLSMHLMLMGAKTPQQISAGGLPCWREPYLSGTRWQGLHPQEAEAHLASERIAIGPSQRNCSTGGGLPEAPQAPCPQW